MYNVEGVFWTFVRIMGIETEASETGFYFDKFIFENTGRRNHKIFRPFLSVLSAIIQLENVNLWLENLKTNTSITSKFSLLVMISVSMSPVSLSNIILSTRFSRIDRSAFNVRGIMALQPNSFKFLEQFWSNIRSASDPELQEITYSSYWIDT